MSRLGILCISIVCLLGSACSGGGGGDDGELTNAVGLPLATYVVVELSTGTITAYSSLSDLNTNNAYKTTHMVFRTIDAGTAYYGQDVASFGQQADETESAASVTKYFIGVFEVTQAHQLDQTLHCNQNIVSLFLSLLKKA